MSARARNPFAQSYIRTLRSGLLLSLFSLTCPSLRQLGLILNHLLKASRADFVATFLEPLFDVGLEVSFGLKNLQGSFSSIQSAEVLLNREVLVQKSQKRTASTTLKACHELDFRTSAILHILSTAETFFHKSGHHLLRYLSVYSYYTPNPIYCQIYGTRFSSTLSEGEPTNPFKPSASRHPLELALLAFCLFPIHTDEDPSFFVREGNLISDSDHLDNAVFDFCYDNRHDFCPSIYYTDIISGMGIYCQTKKKPRFRGIFYFLP